MYFKTKNKIYEAKVTTIFALRNVYSGVYLIKNVSVDYTEIYYYQSFEDQLYKSNKFRVISGVL